MAIKIRTFVLRWRLNCCSCFGNFHVKQVLEYWVLINRSHFKCADCKEYVDGDFGGFADFGE